MTDTLDILLDEKEVEVQEETEEVQEIVHFGIESVEEEKKHYLMKSNGMFCGFNAPEALKSEKDGEKEKEHGLPPYSRRRSFLVDKYPACPTNWMKTEGSLASFFTTVEHDFGMWLDFNDNAAHTHEVAMVVSIQGVNPVTGMPCEDAQLEQYVEKCPKHDKPFGPERLCSDCGYKWPKQNYIATTGTPRGHLWLDGFRSADGVVRQYILTEEKMKGVATNIIGKERVYAIGVSFFLSKEEKPQPVYATRSSSGWQNRASDYFDETFAIGGSSIGTSMYRMALGDAFGPSAGAAGAEEDGSGDWREICDDDNSTVETNSLDVTKGSDKVQQASYTGGLNSDERKRSKRISSLSKMSKSAKSSTKISTQGIVFGQPQFLSPMHTPTVFNEVGVKKVEVGAGASIAQFVYDDPKDLDFWKDKPESIICINYCTELEGAEIVSQGSVDLSGDKEGYLQDIPVGN